MIPVQRLMCWSCRHYGRTQTGPQAWKHDCARRIASCPLPGPDCRHYEYEPGADHREAVGG